MLHLYPHSQTDTSLSPKLSLLNEKEHEEYTDLYSSDDNDNL